METSASSGYNWTMHPDPDLLNFQARVLLDRLERLSADSIYAHRASGLRGAILRGLADLSGDNRSAERERLSQLVAAGFEILNRAAQEIPEAD